MSQEQGIFRELKRTPTMGWSSPPKPVYYNDNGKNTIFIAPSDDDLIEAGVWQYDLDKQQIIIKYPYPYHHGISAFETILDAENKIIYIHPGPDDRLVSFNITTKTWTQQHQHNITLDTCDVFIPSPINQIHFTEKILIIDMMIIIK